MAFSCLFVMIPDKSLRKFLLFLSKSLHFYTSISLASFSLIRCFIILSLIQGLFILVVVCYWFCFDLRRSSLTFLIQIVTLTLINSSFVIFSLMVSFAYSVVVCNVIRFLTLFPLMSTRGFHHTIV